MRRFTCMPARVHTQTIDRLSAADSVLSLLGGLRSERLPPDERIAVATAEIEAIEEWFAACMDHGTAGSASAG